MGEEPDIIYETLQYEDVILRLSFSIMIVQKRC